MIEEARSARPPHLDHADYIGPVVVKSSPGQGEGLFTTRFVKAGELLICEKAFAHGYNTKLDVPMYCQVVKIPRNRPPFTGLNKSAITVIAEKLWKTPSCMANFNQLHRGTYKGLDVKEVDRRPFVDV